MTRRVLGKLSSRLRRFGRAAARKSIVSINASGFASTSDENEKLFYKKLVFKKKRL